MWKTQPWSLALVHYKFYNQPLLNLRNSDMNHLKWWCFIGWKTKGLSSGTQLILVLPDLRDLALSSLSLGLWVLTCSWPNSVTCWVSSAFNNHRHLPHIALVMLFSKHFLPQHVYPQPSIEMVLFWLLSHSSRNLIFC